MDFPKSPDLLMRLIQIGCGSDGIVLDFFAGSCTTAHAVMATNAKDDGTRRFVMVQLPEASAAASEAFKAGFLTVSSLGAERIRRAAAAIKSIAGTSVADVGFRFLRLDTTSMSEVRRSPDEADQTQLDLYVNSVKTERTGEDLVFQVLIDGGLELSLPITVAELEGHEVFVVDDDALIACFDKEVSLELVRVIAKREPLRAVFRDSGFASDAARINAEQIFREISPSTDVKTI